MQNLVLNSNEMCDFGKVCLSTRTALHKAMDFLLNYLKENYYDHYQRQIISLRAEKESEKKLAVKKEKEKLKVVQEEKVVIILHGLFYFHFLDVSKAR